MVFLLLLFSLSFIRGDTLSVLQEFYNATNGDYWFDNSGWNSTTIRNFNGIEVDASGNVVTISLTANNLTGYLPASLANLSTVTDFEIGKNSIGGKLPDFSSWTGLQYFDIHFNNFSDSFPTYVYDFRRLVQLDIGYNNFVGTLNDSVLNWVQLQFLGLANNSFSGPIPVSLPIGLSRLYLCGNAFTGSIPSTLATLVNIQIFDLSRNNLSGTVPDIFGGFRAVKDILLNNNQLSGDLPTSSILNLRTLSVLAIHNNNFTSLPKGVFTHPTLFAFTAQNNQITGDFPSDDVNTTVVMYANLSGPNNNFNQPIPSWAQWTGAHTYSKEEEGKGKGIGKEKGKGKWGLFLSTGTHTNSNRRPGSVTNNRHIDGKKRKNDDGLVLVEYWGYSKCPYYVALTDQIQKLPVDLYPYFTLVSYFFGVASDSYPARYWSMHGQGEAFGDYVTECAIHLTDNQSQWLNFTACVNDAYNYGDVPINTAVCAAGAGYDVESFKTCVRTNGVDYLAEGTEKQLERGVLWSPTIYFNGVEGNGDGDVRYLTRTICGLYNGTQPLPASCN